MKRNKPKQVQKSVSERPRGSQTKKSHAHTQGQNHAQLIVLQDCELHICSWGTFLAVIQRVNIFFFAEQVHLPTKFLSQDSTWPKYIHRICIVHIKGTCRKWSAAVHLAWIVRGICFCYFSIDLILLLSITCTHTVWIVTSCSTS